MNKGEEVCGKLPNTAPERPPDFISEEKTTPN